MPLLRALILDFDGVILESNDLKTRAFEHVFAGYPEHAGVMMEYHHAHVSDSRFEKFRHLAGRMGRPADDPLVQTLADAFSEEMLRQVDRCPMVPGARELLARVDGVLPVFLASVTPQQELETILARRSLSTCFTRVYGCPPWTKVSAVADIIAGMGGPDGIVFIGDSAGDQRAARLTGVEFVPRDSGLAFDQPAPRSFPDLARLAAALEERLPTAQGPT